MIPLRTALRLGASPQVAFVGAGGKSSAMFALAKQFDGPVLVTTSTHLSTAQANLGDMRFAIDEIADVGHLVKSTLRGVVVITGEEKSEDRISGPDPKFLQALSDFARQNSLPLLVEADGARLRALKAPADHEPAIPEFVDAVIVLAGLSAIGKELSDEFVHRRDRFADLSGVQIGEKITAQMIQTVLLNKTGGLKNIPRRARKITLLSQADSPELKAMAQGMAAGLLQSYDAVWIAAFHESNDLIAVHESITGILLAAGESKRLRQPKALLDWKGKSFIRRVTETGLAAGLRPMIVVTGANANQVEKELTGLDVTIMRNFIWYEGQSSSVKAGLRALPRRAGAALFMVVDQPQLPVTLIEQLISEHASSLAPIIAPMVDDHRTNPVLFDRSTFPDFLALEGDVGGRAIFSRHKVRWVPWLDSSLAIDVDTPEDYSRLMKTAGIS